MSLTLSELTFKLSSKTNFINRVISKYNEFEENADMKMLYRYRNESKVVDPFLLALNADYRKLPGGVITVLWEDHLVNEFRRLGFTDANIAFPNIKFFNKVIKATEGLSKHRLYNVDFNIDLHILSHGNYSLMKDAQCILNDLDTPEDVYVKNLITCMESMRHIIHMSAFN